MTATTQAAAATATTDAPIWLPPVEGVISPPRTSPRLPFSSMGTTTSTTTTLTGLQPTTTTQLVELLVLCLGDPADKAFAIDMEAAATVSRLRSAVAACTHLVSSDINLFAVLPGAGLVIDDPRIDTFLASCETPQAGVVRVSPHLVETHLPVTWLKDPTESVAGACIGDGRESLLDAVQKARQLRIVVTLDGRWNGGTGIAATRPEPALPNDGLPAYIPSGTLGATRLPQHPMDDFEEGRDDFEKSDDKVYIQDEQRADGVVEVFPSVGGPLFASTGTTHRPELFASGPLFSTASTLSKDKKEGVLKKTLDQQPAHLTTSLQSPNGYTTSSDSTAVDPIATPKQAAKGVDVESVGSPMEKEAKEPKKKRWSPVVIAAAVGGGLILLALGVTLGVLLGRRNNDNGSPSTVGTSSTGSTSSNAAGRILYTLGGLPGTSPALLVNPLTNNTIITSWDNGGGGIVESPYNSTQNRVTRPGPHDLVHGMASAGPVLVCADSKALSFYNLAANLTSFRGPQPDYLALIGRNASTHQVRWSASGPTAADGVLFVASEWWTKQTNVGGVVVFVDPQSPDTGITALEFAPDDGYPWSAQWVSSDRLFVSMSTGLVLEYRRTVAASSAPASSSTTPPPTPTTATASTLRPTTASTATATATATSQPLPAALRAPWTRVSAFRAHAREVRALQVMPRNRYLVTAGWDDAVRVWDLDALPTTGNLASIQTPVAEYVAFGGDLNDVAVSSDETVLVAVGNSRAAASFPLPQRGKSVATNVQRFRTDVGWNIWHVAYLPPPVDAWVVVGNANSAVVLSNA
ncbi:hypothetical protein HDU96_008488 [Phlyctochytrium bullatum]|nr:hypothetical protein HDU96_008488 [Phlyctochytrium bullatum]